MLVVFTAYDLLKFLYEFQMNRFNHREFVRQDNKFRRIKMFSWGLILKACFPQINNVAPEDTLGSWLSVSAGNSFQISIIEYFVLAID